MAVVKKGGKVAFFKYSHTYNCGQVKLYVGKRRLAVGLYLACTDFDVS